MRSIAEIVLDSIFGAGFLFLLIIAFVGQWVVDYLDHYFFITLFVILVLKALKKFLAYALSTNGSESIRQAIIQPLQRGHLFEQWYWFSQSARYEKQRSNQ